jgi:HlyD family secretion protein
MKAALQLPQDLFIRAGYSANADNILEQRKDV